MKLRTERTKECVVVRRGEDEAKFYGYPLTPKETNELLRKSIDREWERGQRFEETNLYKYKVMKIKRIITDWEGIEDSNGVPLECTDENKEVVYLFNAGVIDEALEKFDKLGVDYQANEEYLEKNLSAGPNGPAIPTE